nr:MAG TPA: hypothetical protein [Caudoviricetes sp.]
MGIGRCRYYAIFFFYSSLSTDKDSYSGRLRIVPILTS